MSKYIFAFLALAASAMSQEVTVKLPTWVAQSLLISISDAHGSRTNATHVVTLSGEASRELVLAMSHGLGMTNSISSNDFGRLPAAKPSTEGELERIKNDSKTQRPTRATP